VTLIDLATIHDTPWLAAPLQQLQRARSAGRFPSALLIHDRRGIGGEAVAQYAARLALCSEPDAPCGRCRDCRLFEVQQHPDFLLVTPLEDSKQIRVEQIRELCEQLALTAHRGAATVAVLTPADSLNANAANALLKTLEEPRAGVSLILVSAEPSRLPATILSRCQRLVLTPPQRAASIAWLERRRGRGPWSEVLDVLGEAPFEALTLDPTAVARIKRETERALDAAAGARLDVAATADQWGRADSLELRLTCFENWLTARIDRGMRRTGRAPEMRNGAHLPESESELNMTALLRLLDGVYDLRRLRLSSINRPLALELLLRGLTPRQ
jgi:DNA polymerase III subunit delta'